ncbi:MAG: response regulator [Methanotrichaceae archaeon]|nr:response regulator [Methanotrichaceae archaeon]
MEHRDIKIMLVEDNPEDVYLTKKVLRRCKLDSKLHLAMDGQEALEALCRLADVGDDLPDLLLLDINLPVMGGIELLRRLKKDERLDEIFVVMLTSSNMDEDIQRSYDLGANTYLVKPISSDALLLVVQNLFEIAA